MNILRKLRYFVKRELNPYSITVLFIGVVVIIADLVYFSFNSFRLNHLIINNQFEILFLLLTGFFLYGFKYDILNVPVTFNAFIIYTANIVLYIHKNLDNGQLTFNSNVLVLIVFFIFVYFILQLFLYIIFRKINLYKAEIIIMRIVLWTTLVVVFNFFIYKLKIDLSNLHFKDIMWLLMLVVIHCLIKTLFQLFERSLQRKYLNFFNMTVSFIFTDSIFMLFAILLGTIYLKIDIYHFSFFIAFLAIVISFIRYITDKNTLNLVYFKILSFMDFPTSAKKIAPKKLIFPKDSVDLTEYFKPEIRYLSFVMVDFKNVEVAQQFISSKINSLHYNIFQFVEGSDTQVCTILPCNLFESKKNVNKLSEYIKKRYDVEANVCHCDVSRRYWHVLDIDYIFMVLAHKIKRNKKNLPIIDVEQKYIFS